MPDIVSFGERALIVNWPPKINEGILDEILKINTLLNQYGKHFILETVHTYCSIAIYLKQGTTTKDAQLKIERILAQKDFSLKQRKACTWQIPVCYETNFSIDLAFVATQNNISTEKLITLHSQRNYKIYFTGFLPGFLYLGGLNQKLHTPRRSTPHSIIPQGSVAIGGKQTGIYPLDSPGGWHIIGSTPIPLFKSKSIPPTPFKSGDFIRFKPINQEYYIELKERIAQGNFSHNELIKYD